MIEILLSCGFDTLEYSWVEATISICTLADYSMAKKRQWPSWHRAALLSYNPAQTRGCKIVNDDDISIYTPEELKRLESL
jgi:hypothetical protein